MISLDKLKAVRHVISHANCPDGISAALIIKNALPDVRVSFMAYGTEEHRALNPDQPGLLFVDCTPIRERADSFVQCGALVLDHHPTARDIVEEFAENGVFGLNEKNECGAWLAYEHVWLPLREAGRANPPPAWDADMGVVKRFAERAAIRDTWKKNDPLWQEACEQAEVLTFFPFEHFKLGMWRDDEFRFLGEVLVNKKLAAARKGLDEAHCFRTVKKTSVVMFQGVSTTSDAAELAEKSAMVGNDVVGPVEIVVGFHYRVDVGKLQLQFSMRSHTGYDVSAFAKHHGGGGHKAAAGFTVDVSPELSANPYAVFRLLLEEFEGGQP